MKGKFVEIDVKTKKIREFEKEVINKEFIKPVEINLKELNNLVKYAKLMKWIK